MKLYTNVRYIAVRAAGFALRKFMPRSRLVQWMSEDFKDHARHNKRSSYLLSEILSEAFRGLPRREQEVINREALWGSQAARDWHADATKDQDRLFDLGVEPSENLKLRRDLGTALAKVVAELKLEHLCEIGSGGGAYLLYLSQAIPGLKTYTGVDLSEDTTRENQTNPRFQNLQFVQDDAIHFLQTANATRVAIVSCGTFTVFSERDLRFLIQEAKQKFSAVSFAILERAIVSKQGTASSVGINSFRNIHDYLGMFREFGFETAVVPSEAYENAVKSAQPKRINIALVASHVAGSRT
jgi:tRNA G46 methylase TrmB